MGAGLKIKCTECGDIIQSEFRHNYVRCSCGATFIDGGSYYTHCGGKVETNEDGSLTMY